MSKNFNKTYWGLAHPRPLSPSDDDVKIYKLFCNEGKTLMLGCTRQLIELADVIMDIDPWYDGENVIKQDWRDNNQFYDNIILDGGLCFTKELCDEIIDMVSKNCNIFVSRVFNHKLPIHKIAAYFPKKEDFKIKPIESIIFDDYSFYIWDFQKQL